MNGEELINLNGLLLESVSAMVQREHLLQCGKMEFVTMLSSSLWEKYTYRSEVPLNREDPTNQNGPYNYVIVCRRSANRFLLAANSRTIVEALAQDLVDLASFAGLRQVSIHVDQLVRDLTEKPAQYVLSSVHARVPAFGVVLRTVSFYGDDVGEASLFRNNMHLATFYACGLRLAAGGGELTKLGSDGQISFLLTNSRRLLEVEKILGFLKRNGYLNLSDIGESLGPW